MQFTLVHWPRGSKPSRKNTRYECQRQPGPQFKWVMHSKWTKRPSREVTIRDKLISITESVLFKDVGLLLFEGCLDGKLKSARWPVKSSRNASPTMWASECSAGRWRNNSATWSCFYLGVVFYNDSQVDFHSAVFSPNHFTGNAFRDERVGLSYPSCPESKRIGTQERKITSHH